MDLERAEDIMQESLVRLWENCSKVEFEKAKSFLFTVGQRLLIDEMRKNKVELAFTKRLSEGKSEDAHFEMVKNEFEQKLQKAISDLPEKQREVFLMNRIDKLSYKEIAEILELSIKSVEKRMHLALLTLKEQLSELKIHKI